MHTWTDDAPAAKTDKQGQKEKIMKALYKKYASLACKRQRAFAQLETSGYIRPINQAVIEYCEKCEKQRVADE